ncbi:hypothetical protein NDU88_006353 [Pleurodeles waltl]|uniref:Uncharacterized protein n=1 Tax=Pleurodeles waltl TaxID=8319 RepID=A0AAV7TD64_PLEWA|nr:hypothetical protein NDU88_006353 [Pleurodeles waltl]
MGEQRLRPCDPLGRGRRHIPWGGRLDRPGRPQQNRRMVRCAPRGGRGGCLARASHVDDAGPGGPRILFNTGVRGLLSTPGLRGCPRASRHDGLGARKEAGRRGIDLAAGPRIS